MEWFLFSHDYFIFIFIIIRSTQCLYFFPPLTADAFLQLAFQGGRGFIASPLLAGPNLISLCVSLGHDILLGNQGHGHPKILVWRKLRWCWWRDLCSWYLSLWDKRRRKVPWTGQRKKAWGGGFHFFCCVTCSKKRGCRAFGLFPGNNNGRQYWWQSVMRKVLWKLKCLFFFLFIYGSHIFSVSLRETFSPLFRKDDTAVFAPRDIFAPF